MRGGGWLLYMAVSVLAACGFGAGHYHGTLGGGPGGPGATTYASGTVGVTGASSNQPRVGTGVCARCGYGIGTLPGYGHLSINRNGRTLEVTDVNLRVYLQWVYHLWNNHSFSLEEAFEVDTLQEPDALTGQMKDADYLGYGSALKWIYHPDEKFSFWLGGGLLVGGVEGTSAFGPRALAGLTMRIGTLGVPVLVKVEGSIARGENDFKQEWVNAGFVFWLAP